MATADPLSSPPADMKQRVQAFDWSTTPLGPMDSWPQSLRIALSICLNSRFPMFVWWGPERINIYNDAYVPILGKRHPVALGKPAKETWHEIWDVVGPQADAVMTRGEATWNDRVQLIMERQGYTEETWFTWSYSPILDESGKIGGMFCACVEETAHVKAEAEVKASHRRFQALATAGAQVLYRMNADWSEMHALDGHDFLADTRKPNTNWLADYIHPDDQPRVLAAINDAVRTSSIFELEHRVRRADGTLGWTRSRAVPLLDDGGQVTEWIGTATDVTSRRENELALQAVSTQLEQQSRRFDQIASTTLDFIYVFDLNWRFLYANRRLLEVWGKTYHQAVGRSLAELGYPDWHVEMHHRELEQVVRTRQPIKGFVPFTGGSGISGVYEYIFAPVLGTDGEVEVIIGTTRDVTDRENLLAELKSERANLAAIVEHAPAFIATLRGPDHVVELTNQKYLDLIGGREIVGKPVREGLPEVVDQGYIDLLDRVYRTGEPHVGKEVPVLLRTKGDDTLRRHVVTFVYQALRDGAGNVSGVFVHGLDVTDLVQSRAELQEREDRFRQVADATPQIIWTGTPDGRIDYYNRRFYEYIGVPESVGAEGIKWENYVHPDEIATVTKSWLHAIQTGEPHRVEFRMKSASGEYCWFYTLAKPARDETGRIYRWFGTTTDIDDRKRVEARDRFLVDLDDAVRPLVDPQEITATYASKLGQHLDVDRCAYADVETDEDTFNLTGNYNRGVASIVGRYRFADFGQQCLDLMRANKPYVVDNIDTHLPPIGNLAAYRATQIQSVICVPLHKRGRFVAAMAVHQKTPRKWTIDEAELLVHIAARCWESIERARVTREREQLLQSEQAARAEAERAGRMKDEFLATLSHELRTPLNAILGWSQVIRRTGTPEPKVMTQAMEVIERNARSQAQIIEDLLDMSRIISGKVRLDVQRLDLAAIVHAAVDTAQPAADGKGVRLQSVIDPLHGVAVTGDVSRLQQVLWNLLTNAIKFTPKGGRVQVLLERVNSHLEISVIDTGEGIKPEFLPYVFDRFRQADSSTTRRHGGLGLGLSIVKQLVELHGGSVRVKSNGLGQGATFIVALPLTVLHPEPEGDGRRHPRVSPDNIHMNDNCVQLHGVRVLVVDDEQDARTLVQRFLEDCEADVTTAGSADEVVALLQGNTFDVLVSDIGMPSVDGYEMIKRVRSLSPKQNGNIPAIALTAYARTEDRIRAISAGFQMHIAKPVEPVELITLVASAAGRTGRA